MKFPSEICCKITVFLDIKNIIGLTLKFELIDYTLEQCLKKMQAEWQTVQTQIRLLVEELSDQDLHCLAMSVCLK